MKSQARGDKPFYAEDVFHPSSFRLHPLCRPHAFTLVEILCVVASIALLAAIIFPVFSRARSLARRTSCVSQLRQIGLATAIYRQDFDELPLHLSALSPIYVNDARLFVCPSDASGGQHDGNDYLEGHSRLSGGVSYEYFPRWEIAQLADWYQSPPHFGEGKWSDLTPHVGCAWHWAKRFDVDAPSNESNSSGWELILTLGGSVRKIRVEEPISQFTPDKYH